MSRVGRATHNFDEVEFETKEEAEVVLFNLWDDLRRYPYNRSSLLSVCWREDKVL